MKRKFRNTLALSALACGIACTSQVHAEVKNIFVMISDGASLGAWDAAGLAQNGQTASSSYFSSDFKKYLMTTYPLNTSLTPTGNTTAAVSYDPSKAWGLSSYNSGSSSYLHQNYTDSAAAGTALSTGVKTYNNAINWDNTNQAITPTLPELAKQQGKVVGTISTVQWSHATPAAYSNAHDVTRNDYVGIANQMLSGDVMDVIMGAGNPDFTDNNTAKTTGQNYNYVGGYDTWNALKTGTHAEGWALVESKASFEALASGDLTSLNGKDRLVATAQVSTTLQQVRSGYSATDTNGSDAKNAEVPTLATMSLAAINVLSSIDKGAGMFLQIEGGAVDWAAHANQTSRLIEEQIDFNNAVDAVVNWVDTNSNWNESLLIITTDHGNAMPSGNDSNTVAHDRIALATIAAGTYSASNPEGVRWWSSNHTNELVPLFARGAGSEGFAALVDGTDSNFATYYADWATAGFDGQYIDNTDVFTVAAAAAIPEPSAMALLGLSSLMLASRRRRINQPA